MVWYTGQFYALTFLQKTMNIEFVQSNVIIAIALILATPLFIYFGRLSDKTGRKKIMMTGLLLAALAYYPIYKTMYAIGDVKNKTEITKLEKTQTIDVNWNADEVKDGQSSGYLANEEQVISGTYTYDDGTIVEKDHRKDGKTIVKLSSMNCAWLVLLIFIQVVFVTMVYGPIAAFLVELFPAKIRYTSLSLPYHIGNGVFGGLTPFIATWIFSKTGDPFSGLIYPIAVALITFIIGMIFIKKRETGMET